MYNIILIININERLSAATITDDDDDDAADVEIGN